MKIWVDADACPNVIKDILYRAAERTSTETVLVANQDLRVPRSPYIRTLKVSRGFDVADRAIADAVETGDLVITADIPLAADVVAKGATALNPRGELYTEDNVAEALAMRNLMSDLRDGGMVDGGPATIGKRDRKAFASALDAWLAKPGGGR